MLTPSMACSAVEQRPYPTNAMGKFQSSAVTADI
jgi:hypothetical protein